MIGLPDYITYNLKIIFVGYNPGERSAITQHHYAGRGNQFWRLLFDAGLTGKLYQPEEDGRLLSEGYGLTNNVSRPSKSSTELTSKEMQFGATLLKRKIEEFQPLVVCFLGKDIYRCYAGFKLGYPVAYGPVKKDIDPNIFEFVAPNPSGRNTVPYTEKLAIYRQLRDIVGEKKRKKGVR